LKILLIILGVIVIAVAVGAVLLIRTDPGGIVSALRPQPPRTEVRTEAAGTRTLIETVSAPGEIEPLTKVEISAEVSARIEQLPFREREAVHRDDVIVKLDDRDLRAAVQSVKALRDGEQFRLQSEQARLAGLRTNLQFARKTLDRQQALYESGDVSRSVLDDAIERVEDLQTSIDASTHAISVIESTLAAAGADIERADDALNKTVIRSPMDGVVTQLNAEIGEVVLVGTMNNPGTVIMTIADLSRMILNARVAESDVAKIAEGQQARIHINAYPDEIFKGIVRKIALQRSTALDGTGFFETEVEIDLQGRQIYSGLVANVDIEIDEHTGIVVQSQAVVERLVEELPDEIRRNPLVDRTKKTTTVVYRVVEQKAVCTPVAPGASDLTHRLVLDGISEDDTVIVGPFKALEQIKHDDLVAVESDSATEGDQEAQEGETDDSAADVGGSPVPETPE
jgi:HlyD family secretion protein